MRTSNYRKFKITKKQVKLVGGAAAVAVLAGIIFFFAFIYIPPYASLLFFKISLLCLFEYVQYLEESFEQFPNVIEDTFLALD